MDGAKVTFNSCSNQFPEDVIERFAWTGSLSWTQSAAVRVHCYWAREAVRGSLAGEFGTWAGNRRALLRVSIHGPLEAQVCRGAGSPHFRLLAEPSRSRIEVAAAWDAAGSGQPPDLLPHLVGVADLGELAAGLIAGRVSLEAAPRPVRLRLAELFPGWDGGALPDRFRTRLEPATTLSDRIWSEAIAALEQRCSADLAAILRSGETALLFEAALDPESEVLATWERLRQGNCATQPIPEGATDRFPLSRLLPDEWLLELHLPLLDRNEWRALLDALRSMEVRAAELGRVLVAPIEPPAAAIERTNLQQAALLLGGALPSPAPANASRPTVAFSERRRLTAPQARHLLPRVLERYGFAGALPDLSGDIELSLTLGLTADAQPWLEAPRARSPEYYAAFGEVSRTLQQALRVWLPYLYFADLERLEEAETALPMLVYQASRPASSKVATDFTYDVMNLESVHRALRTAGAALPEILRTVAQLLAESGREAAASRYARLDPRTVIQSVKNWPRWFQSLLAADAAVSGEVIKLAMATRVLRDEPAEAPRRLYRALEQFTGSLHQRLRRLYGRFSAPPLGSLVLLEASRSLAVALGRPAALQAVLRWRPAGDQKAEMVRVSAVGGRHRSL